VTAEDIVQHIRPQTKDRTLVLIGRITACVVIVLAMIWSPYCEKFKNIFVVINKVPMMFAPAITTVFVLGVLWKRGTKQAALATFIAGLAIGLPYFLVDLPHAAAVGDIQHAIDALRVGPERIENGMVAGYGIITDGWGIPYMMAGLILLCICIAVYVVTSLLTPAPTTEELEKMGWKSPFHAITSARFTGIRDPRLMAGILFVVMIILYYLLR
jgi:SSS family solute:Na+ symporter